MLPPINERNLNILGIVAAVIAALAGAVVFYGRYPFAEPGTNYLIGAYGVCCFLLFFGIRLWKITIMAIAIFGLIGVQSYSARKFSWRENYISLAQMGQPFFLNEFIDHYPTYEEYTFEFMKAPDWVRFNDECVQPALTQNPVPPRCASFDLIQRYYRIDLRQAMSQHFAKMKRTATMVQEGKLSKRSAYAECIANKQCATIPLLPKGVDANAIDPGSQDYIGIRQAFWSLINDKKMSPTACALTPLCKALVNMRVVIPDKMPF